MTGDRTGLKLQLLGAIALQQDGVNIALPPSRKTRALLAYLALNRKPHRRAALCELFWERTDDPRAALRWSLTKLRALLGEALVTDGNTIALRSDELGLNSDLDQLHHMLALGDAAQPDVLQQLEAALDCGYLPGIDCGENPGFDLWLESERAALRQLHCQLLQTLQERAGADPTTALRYARKRMAIDPTETAASLDLLALLLRHEGREPARQAFEQCRERLRQAGIDDSTLMQGWRELSASRRTAPKGRDDSLAQELPLAAGPDELLLPGKPSLAVLGFQAISGDGNQVLSRGLTADLISRLSRIGGLFVIARASSTRFASGEYGFPEIGSLLGVRYLIHGTVQASGQRLRVNVELIDASQARDVWAESFEHTRDDLFLLQDELANAIVSAVEPEIERAEYERARLKPPASLDAWENYHMALWHSFRFTSSDTEAASAYLERALLQDPQFSRVHAAKSLMHFSRAFLNTTRDVNAEIERALECAEHSVGLDSRDAMGHWSLGRAQFLHRQHDLALVSLDRALHTNPNYAQGHYARGFVSAHSGIAADALPDLATAQRLSPFDPLLFAMISTRAISLAIQGNYAEAASCAVRATLEANAHFHIYAVAAACLELAGQHAEARRHIDITRARHAGYTQRIFFRSFPYKHPEQQQLIARALKGAGLT